MQFDLMGALEILERTPSTFNAWLTGLSKEWLSCHEGEGTWNPSQVLDHLIELEKTDWVPRTEMILRGDKKSFPPVDRNTHLSLPERPLNEKLQEFARLRQENIGKIKALGLSNHDYEKIGFHPAFGQVSLRELLSTWVVHDLTHINQVARVMAKRYTEDVGPWKEYLGILKRG